MSAVERATSGQLAAVLFDMDGLLVSTEETWFAVETELMAELGGTWGPEHQSALVGGPLAHSAQYMLDLAGRVDVDRAGSDAVARDRLERPLAQTRMRRETEIVVRREVHDLAMVDGRFGPLLGGQHPQSPVQPLLLESLELVGQKAKGIGAHGTRQYMTDGGRQRLKTSSVIG